MGLDMYLYASKYESKSQWRLKEGEDIEKVAKEFYPEDLHKRAIQHIKDNFLSKQTRYQIGYWRKFNALHCCFEKQYEDKDLIHGIYISKGSIEELIEKFETILENLKTCPKLKKEVKIGWDKDGDIMKTIEVYDSKVALELLPPGDGFFYGPQNIDEYYKENIEYSIELFKECLELIEKGYDIIYDASW